ncbi:hypothetical protein CspHIS471_0312070 [Cutaneotrichosporon sp. HIS471]|nr:hypothetical protein CspHIS471_0312070 [Cutaneotrichosporon sp. HIS471]
MTVGSQRSCARTKRIDQIAPSLVRSNPSALPFSTFRVIEPALVPSAADPRPSPSENVPRNWYLASLELFSIPVRSGNNGILKTLDFNLPAWSFYYPLHLSLLVDCGRCWPQVDSR